MKYKMMKLFIMFDLPTNTPTARREYARFRKKLIENGFFMLQYSVYVRHCLTREYAYMYLRKVECFVPSNGIVRGLFVTDKQFVDMPLLLGALKEEESVLNDNQIVFW